MRQILAIMVLVLLEVGVVGGIVLSHWLVCPNPSMNLPLALIVCIIGLAYGIFCLWFIQSKAI